MIVKRIFREYLEGKSFILQIAKGLQDDGIKTVIGPNNWHHSTIDKKFQMRSGGASIQKAFTVYFPTKKKAKSQLQSEQTIC